MRNTKKKRKNTLTFMLKDNHTGQQKGLIHGLMGWQWLSIMSKIHNDYQNPNKRYKQLTNTNTNTSKYKQLTSKESKDKRWQVLEQSIVSLNWRHILLRLLLCHRHRHCRCRHHHHRHHHRRHHHHCIVSLNICIFPTWVSLCISSVRLPQTSAE